MSSLRAQASLPGMDKRMEEGWTTMRLAERKLIVVRAAGRLFKLLG